MLRLSDLVTGVPMNDFDFILKAFAFGVISSACLVLTWCISMSAKHSLLLCDTTQPEISEEIKL